MNQPRLSFPAVITAARQIIDSDGVNGLSMRRVAQLLGVQAMSLYHYVASREALVDSVVDVVVRELQDEIASRPDPLNSWSDYLDTLAHRIRTFSRQQPHAFELIATRRAEQSWLRPPLRSLPGLETFLAALQRRGLGDEAALYAYRSFTSFLLGHLLLDNHSGTRPGADDRWPAGRADAAPTATSPTVKSLRPLDANIYPTVVHLAAQLREDHTDREFGLGLADLLTRIDRESSRPSTRKARTPPEPCSTREPSSPLPFAG